MERALSWSALVKMYFRIFLYLIKYFLVSLNVTNITLQAVFDITALVVADLLVE